MSKLTVAWLSAGVSSFIASYIIRDEIDEFYYIHIDDQEEDSLRFINDCEKLLGKKIEKLQSPMYMCVNDACQSAGVFRMTRTGFAPCTNWLKKRVRHDQFEILHEHDELTYVWGFDCSARERARAERILETMPQYEHRFPLIEQNLTKQDAHAIAKSLGLKRPKMYDMGYNNNNCKGCIKGGMGYWNKIRVDFPEVFESRAKLERKLGCSILKEYYLDELPPNAGNQTDEIMEDCSIFCELAKRNI